MSFQLLLEIAGAVLAVLPLVAVGRAYLRSGSRRLALALVAFSLMEARMVLMILTHTVMLTDHPVEELLEFGGDLAVIVTFALAFLWGARSWSYERNESSPA